MRTWQRLLALAFVASSVVWVTTGCGQKGGTTAAKGTQNGDDHGHPTEGPHGGVIAEWGTAGKEEYHAEVVFDHDKKSATVYVLDDKIKNPVPIDAKEIKLNISDPEPKQIALKADPQEKDPAGKSSRFVGNDDLLGKVVDFKGKVAATINGKPYNGSFDETKMGEGHKD